MLWLLLACKGQVVDTAPATECGRLYDYPGSSFTVQAVQWPEGQSLYDVGEPSDQTHNSLSLWTTYLDVYGRADPVPDMDWEGKDILLWLNRYDACEPRSYEWLEPFVVDGVRTVPGEFAEQAGCDLQWTEAWVFIIDEVSGSDSADACADAG